MTRKRPLVEVVVPQIVSNLGDDGKKLIEQGMRFGTMLGDLFKAVQQPGGARAVIDVTSDGPRARIMIGEEDGNAHPRIQNPPIDSAPDRPRRRPVQRRIAKPNNAK